MQRFGQLLSKQLFQQPQFPPSSARLRYAHNRVLLLQRQLSLSCPSLSNPNDPADGNGKPGAPGGESIVSTSPAYSTISDILNVTTKARDDGWGEENRTANDRVDYEKAGNEDGTQSGGDTSNPSKNVDPTPVINYATGPGGTTKSGVILGIETSFDDTGIAVVNTEKQILGEALNSQLQIHLKYD